jgi:hypothetical protein
VIHRVHLLCWSLLSLPGLAWAEEVDEPEEAESVEEAAERTLPVVLSPPVPGGAAIPLAIPEAAMEQWCSEHWDPSTGQIIEPWPLLSYRPRWTWVGVGAVALGGSVASFQWARVSRERFYDPDTATDDVVGHYLQANGGLLLGWTLAGAGVGFTVSGLLPERLRRR